MSAILESFAFPESFNLRPFFAPLFQNRDIASSPREGTRPNPSDQIAITTAALGTATPYSIRIVNSESDLQKLYQFRYKVSVEEMNRESELADHKNKTLTDTYDSSATNIAVFRNDEIIGCGRLNFSDSTPLPHREFFNFDELQKDHGRNICWASKLLINEKFRGTRLMFNIVRAFCEITHRKGTEVSVVGCNLDVKPHFEKLGWKVYRSAEDYGGYGVSVPMIFDHQNVEYLESIRSPLVKHFRLLNAIRN